MSLFRIFRRRARRPSPAQRAALGEGLAEAAENGDIESMQTALTSGADVDYRNTLTETPLMAAARENKSVAVALLLENKADITLVDRFGQTALHLALRAGAARPVTQQLFEAGNPVNGRDMHGATPAYYAAQTANAEALRELKERGADFTIAGNTGMTPLMMATGFGHSDAVKTLTGFKCGLDMQDQEGKTALMHAVFAGNGELVAHFLSLGANIELKDGKGRTAGELARDLPARDKIWEQLKAAAHEKVAPFHEGTDRQVPVMKTLTLLPRAGTSP